MALLESIDIPLGTPLPVFELPDAEGKTFRSDTLMGRKGLLLAFTCNHCPYAVAVWQRFIDLAHYGKELGIETVAINPNIHPDYPEDSPEKMLVKAKEWGIDFPYLVDETQKTAQLFKAQCTPDIYLFSSDGGLFYHGRIDDNWKDAAKVKKKELKIAMGALAEGKEAPSPQFPSIGCSIKWR